MKSELSDPGWQQGVLDPGATFSNNFLTGTTLTLFGGDYTIADSPTGANSPARTSLGSGHQTVLGSSEGFRHRGGRI